MRHSRIIIKDGRYHVSAKTTRNEFSFEDPDMKELYREVMTRAKKRYTFEVNSYVIMGNHIHLIIKTRNGCSISRIMQYIQGLFAQLFNRIHNLSGPFWRGRFWSTVIIGYQQFLKTFIYLAYNPVRAQLVSHPGEYAYSGFTEIVKRFHRLIDPPPKNLLTEAWREIKSFPAQD